MLMKRYTFLKIQMLIVFTALSMLQLHAQKIGLLMDSYVTDRWFLDQKFFTDKIEELGGTVQVEVAYGDHTEQVRLAKKLIAEGAKVLVVIPVDGNKAVEIVKLAKEVNIPVIAYDRLIMSQDVAFYISYNNEKVGALQALYALKQAPEGNYLLINGPVSDNNATLFRNGQLKVLSSKIKSGKIKVIGDFIMEDWGEIGALVKTNEFLASSKEKPHVIIAANDALAAGAIKALPRDLSGKVIITGQDADLSGVEYIVDGSQSMTIYKPIKPMARLAGEAAMKLAIGEEVEGKTKIKTVILEVNAILLDPLVVDRSNYKETVVRDGHISLSDLASE